LLHTSLSIALHHLLCSPLFQLFLSFPFTWQITTELI
jgi:hypothetical protein